MTPAGLLILAMGIIAFAAMAKRLRATPLTAPMLFTLFGLAMGGAGLGWVELSFEAEPFQLLAEIALIVILFTDAARMDPRRLRGEDRLAARLLILAMPLSILATAALALALLPDLGIWAAAALACLLAPTDAAVALAITDNPRLPRRLREALVVEAGLNDGLALPLVLITLCFASAAQTVGDWPFWLILTAKQILLGPLAGIAVGALGGKMAQALWRRHWMGPGHERIVILALAVAAFALAETIGGNGFIAAFVGGLVFGHLARDLCPELERIADTEAELLMLVVFFMFGAVMLPMGLAALDWRVAALAALIVLIARPLAARLALIGAGLPKGERRALCWFGPKGIASIVFAAILLGGQAVPLHGEIEIDPRLLTVTVLAVFFSVGLHGASAAPVARLFARRAPPPP